MLHYELASRVSVSQPRQTAYEIQSCQKGVQNIKKHGARGEVLL
jgi:hypothetical protein